MIDSTENIKLDKDKFCFQLMTQLEEYAVVSVGL